MSRKEKEKKKLTLMRMVRERMCCVWTRWRADADDGGC